MCAKSISLANKKVAILVANGVCDYLFNITRNDLQSLGATVIIIAPKVDDVLTDKNVSIKVDQTIDSMPADFFDALYIPGGREGVGYLLTQKVAIEFICSIYTSGRNIAVDEQSIVLLEVACLNNRLSSSSPEELRNNGIFIRTEAIPAIKCFAKAIAQDHALHDYSHTVVY